MEVTASGPPWTTERIRYRPAKRPQDGGAEAATLGIEDRPLKLTPLLITDFAQRMIVHSAILEIVDFGFNKPK